MLIEFAENFFTVIFEGEWVLRIQKSAFEVKISGLKIQKPKISPIIHFFAEEK
jgi:hypothetical protein